jgi:O-antigen ligase
MIFKIIDFLISLSALSIINIPSIKIFYSSDVVNFLLLFALYILGIFKNGGKIAITKNKLDFLKIWSLFWLVFLVYATFAFEKDIILIVRYFITYLYIIGLSIFVKPKHLPTIIYAQIIWGSFVSFANFYGLISLDRSLGQHYLTLGLPISASLCCLIVFIFKEPQILKVLLLSIILLLNIFVLFSLQGRAPILLFGIVTLICFILNSRLRLSLTKVNLFKIIFFSAILFIVFSLIQGSLENNLYLSQRFERLFENTESEPRYFIYLEAFTALLRNPFGYGVGYIDVMDYYPHNIFLEVGLSTGIIGIILLSLLFKILVFALIRNSSSTYPFNFSISALALYLFLTWNISFELGSSYIPFGALAIIIATTDDRKTTNTKNCQYSISRKT